MLGISRDTEPTGRRKTEKEREKREGKQLWRLKFP